MYIHITMYMYLALAHREEERRLSLSLLPKSLVVCKLQSQQGVIVIGDKGHALCP